MSDYRIKFYQKSSTGEEPVNEYLVALRPNERVKITRFIELLRLGEGKLPQPYSKHVQNKLWELRVKFSPFDHRVLYVVVFDKVIVLLHAFAKKTEKTPPKEIERAEECYLEVLNNKNYHEKAD